MQNIRKLMEEGRIEDAVEELKKRKEQNPDDDAVTYELGNAYWKMQDWKNCLDCYTEAIRLNPESPAAEMKKMVMNIIGFYNKEMYNV